MANAYYTPSGAPSTSSQAVSSTMRAEFTLLQAAFDLLPTISGNGSKIVQVNSGATALTVLSTTGSGNAVLATSPTLVTPNIGAATGTSLSVTGQLTSTVATGTAPLVVSSTTQVANLYVARAALADVATTATTASSVTTNANLTGPITSTGNATAVASQTGTGNKFVMDTSPTLVTPVLGVASATSLTASGGVSGSQLTSTIAIGTAPLVVTSTTKVTNLNADLVNGVAGNTLWNTTTLPFTAAASYVPTASTSGGSGLLGSLTVNEAWHIKVGDLRLASFDISTTAGTGTGAVQVTLPTFSTMTGFVSVRGRDVTNGVGLCGSIAGGSNTVTLNTDANASPIATARLVCTFFYR